MSARTRIWFLLAGVLLLTLLALNFLNFQIARSTTEANHSLSVYRADEALPDNMAPRFTLYYAVSDEERLTAALASALQAALERQPSVGAATAVSGPRQSEGAPFLLVEITPDRLWTPVYSRATLEAQLYYAYDGDAPWPLDEPVVFSVSPAVKADGEFTLVDTTWGLISKPAYSEHLAQALARAIAVALQEQVFALP